MSQFNESMNEFLGNPLYSPDAAPSDYYLFKNLKQFICLKRFSSNEEANSVVRVFLRAS